MAELVALCLFRNGLPEFSRRIGLGYSKGRSIKTRSNSGALVDSLVTGGGYTLVGCPTWEEPNRFALYRIDTDEAGLQMLDAQPDVFILQRGPGDTLLASGGSLGNKLSAFFKRFGVAEWANVVAGTPIQQINTIIRMLVPENVPSIEVIDYPSYAALAIPEQRIGDYEIVRYPYEAGEVFDSWQGNSHRVSTHSYTTKLLRLGREIMNDEPWEIEGMRALAKSMHGDVLVGGLGLGILVNILSEMAAVTSVTVVEVAPEVVQMTAPHVGSTVRIVNADFREWVLSDQNIEPFDSVCIDIWGRYSIRYLPEKLTLMKRFSGKPCAIWPVEQEMAELERTRALDELIDLGLLPSMQI